MAKKLQVGNEFGAKLAQAIGLPKETTWFELRCVAGEVISVKAGILVHADDGEIDEVLREFTLSVEPKDG